jgi:major membrane immunogen (membrane-anchored lipoprotein)
MRLGMEMLMKPWKHTLLIVLVVLTILSLLLSACGPADHSQGNSNHGKDKNKHKDKIKENENETETDNESDINAKKVTICHKTGSAKHPYVEITISNDALKDGHAKHQGDIFPAPESGCPTVAAAISTPYP